RSRGSARGCLRLGRLMPAKGISMRRLRVQWVVTLVGRMDRLRLNQHGRGPQSYSFFYVRRAGPALRSKAAVERRARPGAYLAAASIRLTSRSTMALRMLAESVRAKVIASWPQTCMNRGFDGSMVGGFLSAAY